MAKKVRVTIRPMGGSPKTVLVGQNSQVRDVLDMAGIDVGGGTTIVANGETVKPYDQLGSHRELMVVPVVKGG